MSAESPGRRRFLQAAGLGAAALASGCAEMRAVVDPRPPRGRKAPLPDDHGFLARAGFGPDGASPDLRDRDAVEAWIKDQCAAPDDSYGPHALWQGEETFGLRWRLNSIEALRVGQPLRIGDTEILGAGTGFELRDISQPEMLAQLQKAAILRAAYSKWQLRERMADFWSNHFNIYARKVVAGGTRKNTEVELMYLIAADQQNVVRQNALGRFGDLLAASMQSPAMLGYLDNQINRAGVANENYAREVMELHTLGVGGGYSQQDVKEVARCLTGWTMEDRFARRCGAIRFDPDRHDYGPKKVLGVAIPAGSRKDDPEGGRTDAQTVRKLLLEHPSTGRFLGKKLVRYFWGEGEQAPALEAKVADAYRQTDGDIPAMLRALFLAPEFAQAPPLIKRPFDLLVGAVRATGAVTDGDRGIQRHLDAMGQSLFQWPMPDGYPDRTAAWSGSLLPRWNYALALAKNEIPGTRLDPKEALARLGPRAPKDGGSASERIALALCAPEFQWR